MNFAKFLRTPFLQNTSGGSFCLELAVAASEPFRHSPDTILWITIAEKVFWGMSFSKSEHKTSEVFLFVMFFTMSVLAHYNIGLEINYGGVLFLVCTFCKNDNSLILSTTLHMLLFFRCFLSDVRLSTNFVNYVC